MILFCKLILVREQPANEMNFCMNKPINDIFRSWFWAVMYWTNDINIWMKHATEAGSITQPIDISWTMNPQQNFSTAKSFYFFISGIKTADSKIIVKDSWLWLHQLPNYSNSITAYKWIDQPQTLRQHRNQRQNYSISKSHQCRWEINRTPGLQQMADKQERQLHVLLVTLRLTENDPVRSVMTYRDGSVQIGIYGFGVCYCTDFREREREIERERWERER